MSCELNIKSIKRVPFTCPYTPEEWRVIIINKVIEEIKKYKSIIK